jgi:hypothetical protein
MRRSLAILMAAATAIAASAATFTPSQAAPVSPTATVLTDQSAAIQQIRDRHRGDRWRGDDNWRYRHHRSHGRDNSFPGFYFGFGAPFYAPQAYYRRPYYQPFNGYGDCFRTWDGQVICR